MVIPTLRDAIAVALTLDIEERARLVMVLMEIILADDATLLGVPHAGRSAEWWQDEVDRRMDDDTGEWVAVDEAAARVRAAGRRWS